MWCDNLFAFHTAFSGFSGLMALFFPHLVAVFFGEGLHDALVRPPTLA